VTALWAVKQGLVVAKFKVLAFLASKIMKKCQERIPGPQKDVNCKNVAIKNCNDLNEALQS